MSMSFTERGGDGSRNRSAEWRGTRGELLLPQGAGRAGILHPVPGRPEIEVELAPRHATLLYVLNEAVVSDRKRAAAGAASSASLAGFRAHGDLAVALADAFERHLKQPTIPVAANTVRHYVSQIKNRVRFVVRRHGASSPGLFEHSQSWGVRLTGPLRIVQELNAA